MGNTSSLVTINVKNDKFYLDYKEFLKFKEVRDLVNEDNKILSRALLWKTNDVKLLLDGT